MSYRLINSVAVASLVVAFAVASVVLLGGRGTDYRVQMVVQDAGQLVKGNLVQVGGVKIGSVASIELRSNNLAQVELRISDSDYHPLHKGTRASIRATSLSSVAGRVVVLEPGPNDNAAIADGGVIPYTDSQPIVDLDEVLNTLDMQTRSSLQAIVHDSASLYSGDNAAANAGLAALNPALSQTTSLTTELLRDRRTFERFLVQSAGVVSAVAGRAGDLESGLVNAARAATAVAGQTAAVGRTLHATPATLRRADTTLVNVRSALAEVRPALRDSRAAAPRLTKVLKIAAPLLRRSRPVARDTTALLPTVSKVLRRLPALDRAARPAFATSTAAVKGSLPIAAASKYYVPDLFGGLLAGFGGSEGGYYDANGHYVRISLQANVASLTGIGAALGITEGSDTPLGAYRTHITNRCPGAATQTGPDASNPYRPDAVAFCSLQDSPR